MNTELPALVAKIYPRLARNPIRYEAGRHSAEMDNFPQQARRRVGLRQLQEQAGAVGHGFVQQRTVCHLVLNSLHRIPRLSLPVPRHILCRDKSRVPADVRRFDEVAAGDVGCRTG